MRHIVHASLFALAASAVMASTSAQDTSAPGGFRLPTPTPTATDVQGPVDPDAPILTRPRAPTPTPTPRATTAPTPTPTPLPEPSPTTRAVPPPRNSSLPPRFTPPAGPASSESSAVADGPLAFPSAAPDTQPLGTPPVNETAPPAAATAAPAESAGSGTPGWLYGLGGALLLAALGAVAFLVRRRSTAVDEAPAIEPPRVAMPESATPPAESPSPAASGPALMIEAQVKQLARSLRFATLSYDLRVTNRGAQPLEDVRFGSDLVTAHARVPTEQQLADPAMPLAPMRALERLDPGESIELSGEFRLPVNEIRPIPHGKAVVYVPLLRVRAEAVGMDPIARTFIVGLKSPGSEQRLQPFRLDEMPQTYLTVGQKALD